MRYDLVVRVKVVALTRLRHDTHIFAGHLVLLTIINPFSAIPILVDFSINRRRLVDMV